MIHGAVASEKPIASSGTMCDIAKRLFRGCCDRMFLDLPENFETESERLLSLAKSVASAVRKEVTDAEAIIAEYEIPIGISVSLKLCQLPSRVDNYVDQLSDECKLAKQARNMGDNGRQLMYLEDSTRQILVLVDKTGECERVAEACATLVNKRLSNRLSLRESKLWCSAEVRALHLEIDEMDKKINNVIDLLNKLVEKK
jgi:hypothetical protein